MTAAPAQPVRQVRVKLLPQQWDFIDDGSPWLLGYGGRGGGKTLALCVKAAKRARHPKARERLVRKHLVHLKSTVLVTLLEGDGKVPPVLPPGSYVHNKVEKTIRLNGGGVIEYAGLDDPTRARSANLTGCGVEQAEELAADDIKELAACVRVELPDLPMQKYLVANPGPPSHWLAERFGLAGGMAPQPGHRAIHLRSADNIHTPESYREELASYTGLWRARYFDGLWVGSDGLIYNNWSREIHVRPPVAAPARIVVGVDDGYTNPFAVLRGEVDGDGRLHLSREVYESKLLEADKIARVRELAEGAEVVLHDPAAAGLGAALRGAGLPAMPADNDVLAGIAKVHQRLAVCGDGHPRLTVDSGCVNFQREIEGYEWKDNKAKDAPVKENDHLCDALRYIVAYLDRSPPVYFESASSPSPEAQRPPVPVHAAYALRREQVSVFDDDTFC